MPPPGSASRRPAAGDLFNGVRRAHAHHRIVPQHGVEHQAELLRVGEHVADDLPRKQRPKISELCAGPKIRKSPRPAVPGEITLVQIRSADGRAPEIAVCLARTLLVTWPVGGYLVSADAKGNPISASPLP